MATFMENVKIRPVKILVINPNSSQVMTKGLDKIIQSSGYLQSAKISTYTAPTGPVSINNEEDAEESAVACLSSLRPLLNRYDAFLIACYSVHPLVKSLRTILPQDRSLTPIIGIFEASIVTALSLLDVPALSQHFSKFGIVTTGSYWEKALTDGVLSYLDNTDQDSSVRFGGVASTGLNASELHSTPADVVQARLIEATRKLVRGGDVGVICLGCAGMSGMDEIVRKGCLLELGDKGSQVRIVDGVVAGVTLLDGMARIAC